MRFLPQDYLSDVLYSVDCVALFDRPLDFLQFIFDDPFPIAKLINCWGNSPDIPKGHGVDAKLDELCV